MINAHHVFLDVTDDYNIYYNMILAQLVFLYCTFSYIPFVTHSELDKSAAAVSGGTITAIMVGADIAEIPPSSGSKFRPKIALFPILKLEFTSLTILRGYSF